MCWWNKDIRTRTIHGLSLSTLVVFILLNFGTLRHGITSYEVIEREQGTWSDCRYSPNASSLTLCTQMTVPFSSNQCWVKVREDYPALEDSIKPVKFKERTSLAQCTYKLVPMKLMKVTRGYFFKSEIEIYPFLDHGLTKQAYTSFGNMIQLLAIFLVPVFFVLPCLMGPRQTDETNKDLEQGKEHHEYVKFVDTNNNLIELEIMSPPDQEHHHVVQETPPIYPVQPIPCPPGYQLSWISPSYSQ